MNEPEQRAKLHGSKKDGLSPFCSLSEESDSDYYNYITKLKTVDDDAIDPPEEDMSSFVKRVTSDGLIQYVADRVESIHGKNYLIGFKSDMSEVRFLLGAPGQSSSYYNVKHLLESPYWHIPLSIKEELTDMYLSKDMNEAGYRSGDRYYGGIPAEPEYDGPGKSARYWKELVQYFRDTVREYPEYYVIGTSPVAVTLKTPDGKETIDLTKFDALADANEAIEMASHYFDESLFEARKKKKNGALVNPDAGNVEHNIEMFNKMNSPVDGPSNNPISGPFGGDVCAESLNEAAPKKETIELEYKNLEFTQCGPQRDVDDWDEWDRCMDWTYEVDKDDLYTFIFESCIDETDFPEAFEDEFDPNNPEHWAKFESWLDDNFDAIYSKYEEKILENWEEDAQEEAAEEYDPDDYVDWDSMPGGHDDDRYWEDMDEAVAGIRAGSQESTKVFMDSTDDPDNFAAVKVTTEFTTDGDFNSHMFDDGAPVLKYFYRGGTSRVYDVKIPKNSWLVVSPWYGEVFRFNGKGWIMLQDSPSDIQEFTTYVEEPDDLKEGEEAFMEKYSYGLNEEYKREPRMIDYFEQMNSEEDEA